MTRKILIVDDMPDMRMMLNLTLSRNGWDVLEAEDGMVAVDLAQKELPAIVLMDFNMPIKDGVEACADIKQNPDTAHIAVIVYTGAFTQQVQESAMAAGAVDFMTKPLLPAEIRKRIEAVYSAL